MPSPPSVYCMRYKAATPAAIAAPARPCQAACAVGATLVEALEDEEDESVVAVAALPPLVGVHASVGEQVAAIGPGSCSQQRVAIQTWPGQYPKGPVVPVIMAEFAVVVAGVGAVSIVAVSVVAASVVAAAVWDTKAVIGIGVPAVQVVPTPMLKLGSPWQQIIWSRLLSPKEPSVVMIEP